VVSADTVITSFPQRHGRNESDVSDVHKSIRIRLALARKNEIRSVYDLAFIIIDQCSQALFDTSRPINQQPEVLEIFTNTIGFLVRYSKYQIKSKLKISLQVNQRARVFRRFWDILQLPMSSRGGTFSSNQLTDILQETILLRKAKDVSMELQNMISVVETEKAVLGDFLANLRKRMFSRSSSIKEQEEPEEIERYQDNTYSFKGTTDLGKATYKRQEARLTDLHKLVDSVKDAEQAVSQMICLVK
jgi:hypothetical protein